jgi:hypothetical protein
MRVLLICLLTCLAVPCLAQFVAKIAPTGAVDTITVDGAAVALAVGVRVVKPAWNGSWADQRSGEAKLDPQTVPDLISGEFPAGGRPIRFRETIERGPAGDEWLRLRYEVTPSADVDSELIFIPVAFPVAGFAGAGRFFISDGAAIGQWQLPATLPDPYHIAAMSDIRWCAWLDGQGRGLRVEPDGVGITGVSLQDDRQFRMETFECQFAVRNTRGLKGGQTYSFGLTLRPFRAADLAAHGLPVIPVGQQIKPVELRSREPLALRSVTPNAPTIGRYGKLELTLDLSATYDNPFDPEDIDVTAEFQGPGGAVFRVPGFFYQAYSAARFGGNDYLTPQGPPGWRVRFAPNILGTWSVVVTARDRSGKVSSSPLHFECTPTTPEDPGFIRRIPDNPYYLQFDNGAPYFAVGENICWGSTERYAEWFKALGAAGGNYTRIWLVRWNMGLEWMNQGSRTGQYYGLGKYSLDNAYRLDTVMDLARQNGIRVMLCLGYHGELMDTPDYFKTNCWQWNPYNVANGGPCAKPADFWTNEEARKLYQRRLRYLIARWGWDTHILSWEFWNEVNAPAPWVEEMARYMRANDPFQHLVTTTYGNDAVWKIPEVDYTQAHTYGSDENRPMTAPTIANTSRDYTRQWPKPFLMGEFGIDWKTSDAAHDPKGLGTSLHDGIWASIMNRSLGTAAIWYWDNYVHAFNLYREFTSIRKFVDTVPWGKLHFDFARFGPTTAELPADLPWEDVTVSGAISWGRATGTDFTVNPDGSLSGDGAFCTTLYSESKPNERMPLRFTVTYPQDGKVIVRVGTVSQGATLHIKVDGAEVLRQDLPAGEGQGPWKSTTWVEQWKIWQSTYDQDFSAPVPAGKHVIELEVTGKDWVSVPRITFTGVRDPRLLQLDRWGLVADGYAIFWLHDPNSNWYNDKYNKPPQPILGAKSSLTGLRDGHYRLEWWDTRKGETIKTEEATCTAGTLPLTVPGFLRDIAGKAVAL